MPVRARRERPDESGFTLLELMVVVLVIAVLLAIAVPTFLGARSKAHDRATQTDLRTAATTQMILFTDQQEFTDDVMRLGSADPSISYTNGLGSMLAGVNVVYVEMLPDTVQPGDTVLLGGRSASGRCYWVRSVDGTAVLRFAENDCTGVPALADFRHDW